MFEIKGDKLVITLPLVKDPQPSKGGKSRIAAGTGGFTKSGLTYKGKDLSISVNAIIPL